MISIIASIIAVAFDSTTVNLITSLFPIVAIFCAPVAYVCGNITFTILVLSWLLQALTVAFLAWFCAKIYRDLLMHKGSRVQFKELLSMAKTSELSAKGGK